MIDSALKAAQILQRLTAVKKRTLSSIIYIGESVQFWNLSISARSCATCVFWRVNCSLSDHQINGFGGKSPTLWNSISCVLLYSWWQRPPSLPFLAWAGAVVRPAQSLEVLRTTSWVIVHSALVCQALTSSSETTSIRHPSHRNPYLQMIPQTEIHR